MQALVFLLAAEADVIDLDGLPVRPHQHQVRPDKLPTVGPVINHLVRRIDLVTHRVVVADVNAVPIDFLIAAVLAIDPVGVGKLDRRWAAIRPM